MIELLIRRHVPEWHGEIEYSSLERLPSELIDERLRRRYPDMIWRARTIDGTTDLVLLLELQGRPERHMVLRTTTYNVLAVQELIEHDKELASGERQLAVESLVLHQFMARGVKAMLRSKGFDTDQLKEAMTMGTVDTEFRRGWDAVRQEGIGVGQVRILSDLATRKFGQDTAKELSRLLARTTDGEQIDRVAAAIVDCDVPDDFLARVRGG